MMYAASKIAVARWVRRHAVLPEWAGAGVRLNAIAPGAIMTPMLQEQLSTPRQAKAVRSFPVPVGGFGDVRRMAGNVDEYRRADREQDHEDDDGQRDHRHLVAAQPAPGQLPLATALDGLLGRTLGGRRLELEIGDAHADSLLPAALAAALPAEARSSPAFSRAALCFMAR